ncbi:hypothetical protein BGZ60DRAFT_424553 [Tricladium varicosporioides]|nr:hypothetical protein BGZ60DRAFT_424553 [Hymenoscyphus varicosporioides]
MRFFTLFASALAIGSAIAQVVPVAPFVLDGGLEDALTDTAANNTGGKIVVYGQTITVPTNVQVQFPASWVPYKDFVAAKADLIGHEVEVTGNYVNNVPIAAMIKVSHFLGAFGQGVVANVGIDGTMVIAGGPTLRINTPNGIFGPAYTLKPQFTADEANPTIVSFSGYPMCLPRSANDPLCPSANRPTTGNTKVFHPAQPTVMAPFKAGDYVTYSGIRNGGSEILCYSIIAENIQILTAGDNGDPVYLRVEDAIIAVNDGSANVEIAETRFIGYISDSTASVSVYALDIDPCTGVETERMIAVGGLKVGDARFKFVIRFIDTSITKATREYRIKANKGVQTTPQGIFAGTYVTPISAIIWPEITVPGIPMIPNAFQLFGFLANGYVMDNQQWGPLRPWPGATAPTPIKICIGNELTGGPTGPDVVTITSYKFTTARVRPAPAVGTVTVSATTNRAIQGAGAAKLTLFIGNAATGTVMTQDATNFGLYTATVGGLAATLPSQIKVTSSFGGIATRTTVLKRGSRILRSMGDKQE